MAELSSVCVFCGSNGGTRREYVAGAAALGRLIAARGLVLVYGGARVGLMGALADAALAAGGRVIGIIPEMLVAKEIAHESLSELHVVSSMHERKARMADLSDGFIALPGGAGTLEEIFEVWTWGQLGHHRKPVGFLNIAGFFDRLAAFLDHQRDEGFMRPEHRAMALFEERPEALLSAFAAYEPPSVPKWIRNGER